MFPDTVPCSHMTYIHAQMHIQVAITAILALGGLRILGGLSPAATPCTLADCPIVCLAFNGIPQLTQLEHGSPTGHITNCSQLFLDAALKTSEVCWISFSDMPNI